MRGEGPCPSRTCGSAQVAGGLPLTHLIPRAQPTFTDSSDLIASELRRFCAVDAASVWPHARALVYEPALARLAAVERRGFRQTHAEMPSMGGIGCALSHLCTWLDILYDAATTGSQRYLVMEDDAIRPPRGH